MDSPLLKGLVPCNPMSVDIGGSMVKIVLWERAGVPSLPSWAKFDHRPERLPLKPPAFVQAAVPAGSRALSYTVKAPSTFTGALRFIRFPEQFLPDFFAFVKENGLADAFLGAPGSPTRASVPATGEAAAGYAERARSELGVGLTPLDELRCCVKGLTFLLNNTETEIFTLEDGKPSFYSSSRWGKETGIFPYMLVTIGSGASVLKVTSSDSFERVSGTALGGASFWGLCKMLTDVGQYEDVMSLVENGDSRKADLVIGDIYGGSYSSIGLPADVTASFFGKLQRPNVPRPSTADVAKSLLNMVIMNVAQISFLNATLHGLKTIFFSGSFLRNHPQIWQLLTNAIQFWSKGTMKPMFLLHDGYLGALGALLERSDSPAPFAL